MRARRIFFAASAVVLIAVAALIGNTVAGYLGWTAQRVSKAELSGLLSPYYEVHKPAGDGPFPTALLYSGCDGVHDNMARWADMLVHNGWAAIVVDSHTPRDYADNEWWRLICTGQLLTGAERAGDVVVTLADAREMDFVDKDRMALIGMSHGGWSIMDLLALDTTGRLPFNLRGMSSDDVGEALSGVRALVLVYPWCGLANRARQTVWQNEAPILFLLATDDIIAPSDECIEIANALEAAGHTVETRLFSGVTHGFDQSNRSVLSPLQFDPVATATALRTAANFLAKVAPPPPGS